SERSQHAGRAAVDSAWHTDNRGGGAPPAEIVYSEIQQRAQIPGQSQQRGAQRQPVGLIRSRAHGRSRARPLQEHHQQHRVKRQSGDVSKQIEQSGGGGRSHIPSSSGAPLALKRK